MRSRKKQPGSAIAAAEQQARETEYRVAVACMARTLVADMFAGHRSCALRECRAARCCQAYGQGGCCPVEMDGRQSCVLAGMMAFHDVLHHELFDYVPPEVETGPDPFSPLAGEKAISTS